MPILAAETSTYPEDLFADPDAVCPGAIDEADEPEDARRWWALRTRVRQEKALARQLLAQEIPFYLPLTPKDNCIRGRHVRSLLPLFSGYLFLYGRNSERVQSLATDRVAQVLPVVDQHQLWRDLRQVNLLIASGAPLAAEQRLEAMSRVRVTSGPMKGVEGTVICRRGRRRLLVSINFLQQGASVEIDDFQVEPLN